MKIKTWDRLTNEFKLVEKEKYSLVNCSGGFTSAMEDMLPENRIIEIKPVKDEFNEDILIWYVDEGDISGWEITSDMIEKHLN